VTPHPFTNPAAPLAASVFTYASFLEAREAQRARRRKLVERAREIARRLSGVRIEFSQEDKAFVVSGPLDDTAEDPLVGLHLCVEGHEVLNAVKLYAAALQR
jgi:hypothetical protein